MPLRVISFRAENFKCLKIVEIEPDPHVNLITGRNAQGKTSVLDALFEAVKHSHAATEQPVRKGTDQAVVKLVLGENVHGIPELHITRKFNKSGTTSLTVTAGDGITPLNSPQTVLDALYSKLSFDPLEFKRKDTAGQLEALKALVKLDLDVVAFEAQNEADYNQRTDRNRRHKALRSRLDALPSIVGAPAKPVDAKALTEAVKLAQEHNEQVKEEGRQRAELAESIDYRRKQAEKARQDAEALLAKADQLDADAAADEEALQGFEELATPQDTSALFQQITDAQRLNNLYNQKAERVRLEEEHSQLVAEADKLTEKIAWREEQVRGAFSRAKLPIKGLTFNATQVLYNDVPLSQASDAEQLRVSVGIAMAGNSELRVIRIRDGSLLDDTSLGLLKELAQANDFQLWIEMVDSTGKVGIVLENGEVVANNA